MGYSANYSGEVLPMVTCWMPNSSKLAPLLKLHYGCIDDAKDKCGPATAIRQLFVGFQRHLYERALAASDLDDDAVPQPTPRHAKREVPLRYQEAP